MFYRRTLLPALAGKTSAGKVRLLFGARQTGKTELLRRLLDEGTSVHFDLQDGGLRRRWEEDPSRMGREFAALPASVRTVFVDEIQKIPALLDEIQSVHDRQGRRWEIFLTGSSARRLRRGAANLLPGRCHIYRLSPVVRWEHGAASWFPDRLGEPNRTVPEPATTDPPFPERNLERMLLYGGLPGVVQEPDATAAATLNAYVEAFLEEEIRREAVVRDLGPLSAFLRLTAVESGRQINIAALSRQSGVAQSTLKTFYQVLEDTFVGYRMSAYGHPGRKRLLSTPRFYLFDLGVRNAAAHVPFDPGVLETQGGPMLEHWVALELLHRAEYRGRGHTVSFWRTVAGAEVDLIWESPGEDIPIEVKWTSRPAPADARHLELFLDSYPRRARRGLIVCRCEAPQQLSRRVTAIPWTAL